MHTTAEGEFCAARRVNRALTASLEKRLLVRMAHRTPGWVTSDQLTVLALCAQAGAGACYALARWDRELLLLAIVFLALNWLGDSLDGTLARVRRQERPRYGFYVDHVVDIFGAAALLSGLALSGLLHASMAMAMLAGFLLLAAESYLATPTLQRFQLSQGIFGPTEVRILLAIGTLAAFRQPYASVLGHRVLLFDLGGAIAAVGMLAMVAATAWKHTRELFQQEPLP